MILYNIFFCEIKPAVLFYLFYQSPKIFSGFFLKSWKIIITSLEVKEKYESIFFNFASEIVVYCSLDPYKKGNF